MEELKKKDLTKLRIPDDYRWVIAIIIVFLGLFGLYRYIDMQREISNLKQNQVVLQRQLENAKRQISETPPQQSWWDWLWDKVIFWD